MNRNLHVYTSLQSLSLEAADYVIKFANEAIISRGVFRIALAGGSTPRGLYEVLSSNKYIDKTDWSSWMIYFSDERVVPLTDERSNYAMANEYFISRVALKKENIYVPPVHLSSAAQIAGEYESQIRRSFTEETTLAPRLDLILLGLGSDGHTASLFPDKPALNVVDRLVVESTPGVLPPPVDRITFTLPFINAARRVMFLASGEDKSNAFQSAYYGRLVGEADQPAPAYLVNPEDGSLDWFVTKELSGDK
jgi:6-phosphogluconolactonase